MTVAKIKARDNNGLHQTGRGGVALRLLGPVVEARPAGEPECYPDISGGTRR